MPTVPLDQALTPPDADLLRRLGVAARGANAHLWLVGGSVRDALLGRPVLDLDLASEAPAAELGAALAAAAGGRLFAHSRFGTAKLQVAGRTLDLATARTERYLRPGALPTVAAGDMRSDLARRDISINAMAASLEPEDFGTLLDPEGGLEDLRDGLVRVLHERSFQDDATRIVRVVRYATRLGFRMDRRTRRWLRRDLAYLDTISPARGRRELERLLREDKAAPALLEAHRLGVLSALHPALGSTGVGAALGRAARRGVSGVTLLGVLLYGVGPRDAPSVSKRLAFTRRQSLLAAHVYRTRKREHEVASAVRPSQVWEAVEGATTEAVAAVAVASPDARVRTALARYLKASRREQSVDGADLVAMGIAEGPEVGRLLRKLRSATLDGSVRSRSGALAWLERARESGAASSC